VGRIVALGRFDSFGFVVASFAVGGSAGVDPRLEGVPPHHLRRVRPQLVD
jgi:hypothetical protein